MKKIVPFVTILLFGLYGAKLLIEDKLGWYINKRYEGFFTLATVICVVIGLVGVVFAAREKRKKDNHVVEQNRTLAFLGYLPIIFTLVVGISLAPKTLSASSKPPQAISLYALKNYSPEQIIKELKLGKNSRDYTFSDWLHIRDMDEKFKFQNGKQVKLTGLVIKPEGTPEDIFFVGRYLIICCAVDATTFGFPVESETWREVLNEGDWVGVQGHFEVKNKDGKNRLIIIPDNITKIPQPPDPYIYY